MDPHRRRRGTAPPRLLPHVLGLAALLLGLLGVGLRVPVATAGHAAAADAGHRGVPVPVHAGAADTRAAAATVQHLLAAPRAAGDPGAVRGDGCHLEMAMAGMCVLALSACPALLRLAARACRPAAGRGPTAAPSPGAPHSRAAPRPSLVQLSISRT